MRSLLALLLLTTAAHAENLRTRLKADSLRLTVNDFVVSARMWHVQGNPIGQENLPAKITYTLENRSGIGLWVAVRRGGVAAGPCTEDEEIAGINAFDQSQAPYLQNSTADRDRLMRWLPDGSKASGTITLEAHTCNPDRTRGLQKVPVTITFVIADEDSVMNIPLSADDVPVRGAKK